MIKTYTQGLALDNELFSHIGKWALDASVHEQVGMAITGQEGDIWLVNLKNDKAIGFAQIRPMKNGHFHMRYLYSDSLNAKLELGKAAAAKAKDIGAELIYINERAESPVMPTLDFVKTTQRAHSKFARWERKVS